MPFQDLQTFISTYSKSHVGHFLKTQACKSRAQSTPHLQDTPRPDSPSNDNTTETVYSFYLHKILPWFSAITKLTPPLTSSNSSLRRIRSSLCPGPMSLKQNKAPLSLWAVTCQSAGSLCRETRDFWRWNLNYLLTPGGKVPKDRTEPSGRKQHEGSFDLYHPCCIWCVHKEDLQFLELSITHFVTLDQPLSIPVPQFPYQYKLEITLIF